MQDGMAFFPLPVEQIRADTDESSDQVVLDRKDDHSEQFDLILFTLSTSILPHGISIFYKYRNRVIRSSLAYPVQ
jgi:pyruvate/2-oxoacid:ferredoxin oxidoreductase alpha subunit